MKFLTVLQYRGNIGSQMLLVAGAFKHFKTISVMILKHKIKNICVYDGVGELPLI